jgi:hypothetical protein
MAYGPYGARLPRSSLEVVHELSRLGKEKTVGDIFFVDGFLGDDTYDGLSRDSPLKTIAHALTHCAAEHDDHIIVMDCYQQETFPIHLTKNRVHVLGLKVPPDGSLQLMDPPTDTPIFTIDPSVQACEIAGFSLGGFAQSTHGAIELAGANNMTHIHHNTFGHYWGSGGQDGIRVNEGSHFSCIIEDNWFYGHGGPNGRLTRYGIYSVLGMPSIGQWTIRNNKFIMLPTEAICLLGNAIHEVIVDENIIACSGNVAGAGIHLGANALGCLVTRNRANFGDTEMANNPFLDDAPAGSNHWADNMKGITLIMPA